LINGANSREKLIDADASGVAPLSYPGVFAGSDTITAFTDVNGKQVQSAPITLRWHADKHTSYLTLNASQSGGALGQPATLRTSLLDVSAEPAIPIADSTVTLSLAGRSCTATTDSSGDASCQLIPPGVTGLEEVTASYAGSSTYTPSTASNVFEAGGVGLQQAAIPISAPGTNPVITPKSVVKKASSPPLAQVLGLPSAQKCLSKRTLVVHVHAPVGQKPLSVKLTLGKKVLSSRKFTKGKSHKIPSTVIDLKGLPKGTFTLKIVVKTKSGKSYTASRTYHTCVARKKKHKKA
jgi:hypothetical protein